MNCPDAANSETKLPSPTELPLQNKDENSNSSLDQSAMRSEVKIQGRQSGNQLASVLHNFKIAKIVE